MLRKGETGTAERACIVGQLTLARGRNHRSLDVVVQYSACQAAELAHDKQQAADFQHTVHACLD